MAATQIGTIDIIGPDRVYPIDPQSSDQATTVCVPPGQYPLYRDGLSTYWVMSGRVNTGRVHRLGDGVFSMSDVDRPEGPEVTFLSRVFGPDEWAEFIDEPVCTEGDPAQRLRVHL